jgi:hypothetical protein
MRVGIDVVGVLTVRKPDPSSAMGDGESRRDRDFVSSDHIVD